MKRIVDEPSGPLEQRAARLIASVGPLPTNDIARERVRRALDRPAPGLRLRRPLLAFLGALLISASAAAVWGGVRYFSREKAGESVPASAAHEKANLRAAPPALSVPSPLEAPLAVPSAPISSAPIRPPAPSSRALRPSLKPETTQTASETLLVQEAVDALRNRGDADRADELLEKYLKKGDNQLAEEALALSIEANLSRNPSKAQSLARTYLSKYPNGRFKSLAERALRTH